MLSRSPLLAFSFALALSGLAAAQTTHVVNLAGTSFSQPSLTIAVGDTVQWVWLNGMHSVESGVGGVPDGNFTSGPPVFSPHTFSVTFDAAFLAANPMPGKVYPYYCAVHVDLGMDGTVTVAVPSGQATRNVSNPDSVTTAGAPKTGTNMFVFVDLTTTGHSSALLFGFDTPVAVTLAGGQTLLCLDLGGNGELLAKSVQPGPTALFGLSIPNQPGLCGFTFSMQAIHLGGVVPFALSNAIDVTVGNS